MRRFLKKEEANVMHFKKALQLILIFLIFPFAFSFSLVTNTIENLEFLSKQYNDYRIFYNLGQLYWQTNNIGRGLLNIKKAALLKPSDRNITRDLNELRIIAGISPVFFETTPIEKAVLFPFSIFDINTSYIFGLTFFIIGSILLTFAFLQIYVIRKRIQKIFAFFFLVIGLVYIVSSMVRYSILFNDKSAVVGNLSTLYENYTSDSMSIGEVKEGTECVVKKDEEKFLLIQTIDGKEGWINRTNIEYLWK